MTTNSYDGSAQIYDFADFAARLRPARQLRDMGQKAVDLVVPRIPQMSFGSAWYHEEAIQDSGQPRTH